MEGRGVGDGDGDGDVRSDGVLGNVYVKGGIVIRVSKRRVVIMGTEVYK